MRKIFGQYKKYLFDHREDLQERLFVLLTTIALIGLLVACLTGLFIGENWISLAGTMAFFFLFVAIVGLGYRYRKLRICANFLGNLLVFIFFPLIFFTSGGIYGGPTLWFLFAVLYIGMILRGKMRIFLLIGQFVVAAICYYLQYYELVEVVPHNLEEFYLDTIGSFIIVGIMLTILVSFQTYVYRMENKMALSQKEEIDALSKAQNRFFSSMSHEIRTPINTIIGLNEMILREDISPEVAEDARNVSAASKMLLNLINDILDLSRINARQMRLMVGPYRPTEMIADVVSMIQVRAQEKKLLFTVNISESLPLVLSGDEVRIKQILINILSNAVKYTEEGRVTLAVECEGRGKETELCFSVSDTGMGIKKENIPYLFTAFRRMDEDRNKHIEGTGLGLSIVKQLLDLMGGTVKVNSIYQKGTTFMIRIPQEVINEDAAGAVDLKSIQDGEGYRQSFEAPDARVLAVDDTKANLLVVSKLLRDTKISLDTASSGAEALNLTLQKEYHVILMDHLMPEMDGIECMHRIREQVGGLSKKARIVALTANAGREDRVLYEREGFDGYMTKPVSGAALESELFRQLPKHLVTAFREDMEEQDTVRWRRGEKKKPYAITMSSISDLPKELVESAHISVIPIQVETARGFFRDGIDLDTDAVLSFMNAEGREMKIHSATADELEGFFLSNLQSANNVIHLSVSSGVADTSYFAAMEAKRALDNVTVVDTGQISSGLGLMVLEACRMAEEEASLEEIQVRMEEMRNLVHTSFLVDNLDRLAESGQVGWILERLTRAFMIRPEIRMEKRKDSGRQAFLRLQGCGQEAVCGGLPEASRRDRLKQALHYLCGA
ncbi:MAG: DegV family EDD domain-containing protein [Lachnospiraceae bacterium]|nr:DegV family EDD domain-containing protein [Lachnospiraceae bacterium]